MLGENVRSGTAGPTIKSTGYPRWPPISLAGEPLCRVGSHAATKTIPIVFLIGRDLVSSVLSAASLNRAAAAAAGGSLSFLPSPELLDVVAAVSIILDEKRPGEGAWKVKPS